MRAVVLYEHGPIERLRLVDDFPDPQPGPDEVLVRIRAVSLNYHDVFTCHGMPGVRLKFPEIIGMDYAGEVAEVGSEVTGWAVGDRVLVDPFDRRRGKHGEMIEGGCCEYCVARAHQLIRLPPSVSFEQAASLPVAYGTAHRMMVTQGGIAADEKVLILGASGGVGSCCVMLGKIAGAHVIACGSTPEKLDILRELGADDVINYAEEDFVQAVWDRYGKPRHMSTATGVDVVINFTGGDTWVKSLRCLRNGGRMLTCGATAGFDPKTDIRYIWTFELSIIGSNAWEPNDLVQLVRLVDEGRLKPLISEVVPLEETVRGLRLLEDRAVIGKVVVTV